MDISEYRLLRLPEVMAITGLSKNTILRLVKLGLFPQPVKPSLRAIAWRWCDIRGWLESLPPAT